MRLITARSIRIGTTALAAISLAVSLVLATRAMAAPAATGPAGPPGAEQSAP
jgi:hypothetical protein